ncbi:TonB-dependent siderophore receptor [Sinirhodobacter populi]|uniref:TonB-dependent siderophore receptor n=1 Tax=Paenirhodobacter populi TaxID=2306993 RepID=A0A443K9G3_9RHOB|nr:TonB-dependent siderophore receptor [Sinirhodobacter populi]RWR29313.1 TonB-dependent siderophore receptor [Sinirhodobacter populi]
MSIDFPDGKGAFAGRRYLRAALWGCTALVVLSPVAPMAQQAVSDQGDVLPQIVVEGVGTTEDADDSSTVALRSASGSRMAAPLLDTPASVSVVTAKEIEDRGATSVEQVLQYTAGVTTDYYGSDDRFDFFMIRGFEANTYRDGLPLGAPFGGIREEPFAFERVEVVKGANSTTFGVSDPGGSVNYVTKLPRDHRFGQAYVTGGSFDHREVGFDFGDKLAPESNWSYRITGKWKDANKEYDHSRDDERFLMGGLTWQPTDATSLSFVIDYLKRDSVPGSGGQPVGANLARSTFLGEPDYNFRGVERTSLSMLFSHDFGTGLSMGAGARYSKASTDFGYAYIAGIVDAENTIASRAFFGNDSSNEAFVADAHLQYDTSFATVRSRTLAGVEYRDSSADNTAFYTSAPNIDWSNPVYSGGPGVLAPYSSNHTNTEGKAIYLQQEFTFSDRIIATFGLRHDWLDTTVRNRLTSASTSGDVSKTTKRIGLTYKVTDEFSTFASYAESVAPPDSTSVEPEEGKQYELGVKYQPAAMRALFSAAVYDLTKTNISATDPVTLQKEPIGKVRVRGIDLEAKAELTDRVSLIASYSHFDSKIVDNGADGNVGNRMQFVPKDVAALWATYSLPGQAARNDLTFGLGARYTGSYYMDNANTQATGGAVTYDAAVTYDLREDTTLALNVSNLFDKKYVAYGGFGADFYNPGREVALTLRHSW